MKYIQRSDITKERIDDKIVLFDSEKFLFFELNETMSFIWDSLEKEYSLNELTDLVKEKYNLPQEQANLDTSEAVEELKKLELIKKNN